MGNLDIALNSHEEFKILLSMQERLKQYISELLAG